MGGLPKESREAYVNKSRAIDVGISKIIELRRKGATRESTREEIRKATNVSLFNLFYDILDGNNFIQKVDIFDIQAREQLQVNDFVEVQGKIEFSASERMFELTRRLKIWAEALDATGMRRPEWKRFKEYLENPEWREFIVYMLDIREKEQEVY